MKNPEFGPRENEEVEKEENKNSLTPEQASDLEELFELKEDDKSIENAEIKKDEKILDINSLVKYGDKINIKEGREALRIFKGFVERDFKLGAEVKVLRSSGVMDDGWTVEDIDPFKKEAKVRKSDGEYILSKRVSIDNLKKWNGSEIEQSNEDKEKVGKEEQEKKENKLDIEMARAVFTKTGFIDGIEGLAIGARIRDKEDMNTLFDQRVLTASYERFQELLSANELDKEDVEELLGEIIKALEFSYENAKKAEDVDSLKYLYIKIHELRDASSKLSINPKGNFIELQPSFLKITNLCEEGETQIRNIMENASNYQLQRESFKSSGFIESIDSLVMVEKLRDVEGMNQFFDIQGLRNSLEYLQDAIRGKGMNKENMVEALDGVARALESGDLHINSGGTKEDMDNLSRIHMKLSDIQEASLSISKKDNSGEIAAVLLKIANLCEEKDSQIQKAINVV